jgi:hypothetical protein
VRVHVTTLHGKNISVKSCIFFQILLTFVILKLKLQQFPSYKFAWQLETRALAFTPAA